MPADEWLSTLLEYTQDKIAVIDESGEYVYVNRASRDILGYDPETLVGENVFAYVHEDDVGAVRRRFERLVATDGRCSETVRYRHRSAAGEWMWLESRVSSIEGDAAATAGGSASGTVPDAAREGYVVSARDISDQVVAERERRQARQRLETITRTASDVLWLFSGDWDEVLFVNPAYEDVFGRPIDELERDPTAFLKAVHPDDVAAARNAMERLTDGESVDIEYRVNPNGDGGRWVWVKGEPVVADGEVTRIAGFTRDITDRRRRERQLTVMDTLLRHNLRNELCLILGHAELIADTAVSDEANGSDDTDEPAETGEPSETADEADETDEPDDTGDTDGPIETDAEHGTHSYGRPETTERAKIIRQHGERLLESAEKQRRIIDLLIDYPAPEPIDLVDVVRDVVERTADRYAISVETDLPASAPAMTIDEIGAALRELLENAIEHAPDDRPTLSVSVRSAADDTVAVTIEDDCPPIPELEFRVLTGDWEMTDVYHTSGLGLWLVYWTVDISDGWIEFSHDETGNTITVLLPDATGG